MGKGTSGGAGAQRLGLSLGDTAAQRGVSAWRALKDSSCLGPISTRLSYQHQQMLGVVSQDMQSKQAQSGQKTACSV